MNPSGRGRTWGALAIVTIGVIGTLVAWFSRREAEISPPAPAREQPAPAAKPTFDFYLMALTVRPAFCADGHERQEECRSSGRVLVIHGLWPERNEPRTYPRDCQAPPLDLDPVLARQLQDFMPGMADHLHEHEWRTHGGCSGLDDDEYFSRVLDLARGVDSALSAKLTTLAGRETTGTELREFADLFHPGIGRTLTFHCRTLRDAPGAHRREPYLIEVRQCVDNDGPGGAPATALDCATVNRSDQGCGPSFRIAAARDR